jgi:putative ubiquitin-RnfH superfamily antitoxin RatB of RatAB toxin-antitoxin module
LTLAETLTVEVVFALPLDQDCTVVRLPDGASVRDAIARSGVAARQPTIDLGACRVGIWGRLAALDERVRDGDRVEIYRPLQADPKEARRQRAQKTGERRRLS